MPFALFSVSSHTFSPYTSGIKTGYLPISLHIYSVSNIVVSCSSDSQDVWPRNGSSSLLRPWSNTTGILIIDSLSTGDLTERIWEGKVRMQIIRNDHVFFCIDLFSSTFLWNSENSLGLSMNFYIPVWSSDPSNWFIKRTLKLEES